MNTPLMTASAANSVACATVAAAAVGAGTGSVVVAPAVVATTCSTAEATVVAGAMAGTSAPVATAAAVAATGAAPLAVAKTAAGLAGGVPGVPGIPGVGGVARVAKMGANMAISAMETAATPEPVCPPCDGAPADYMAAVGPGGINPLANMGSLEKATAHSAILRSIDSKIQCPAAKYSVGRIGLIANWQRRIFKVVGLSIIRYMKGNSPAQGFKDVHIDSSTVLYDNPTPEVHPQAKTDLDVVLSFTEKGKPLKLLIRFDHAADKKYWVQNLCFMIMHKKYH